jgi:hypothetical protein
MTSYHVLLSCYNAFTCYHNVLSVVMLVLISIATTTHHYYYALQTTDGSTSKT